MRFLFRFGLISFLLAAGVSIASDSIRSEESALFRDVTTAFHSSHSSVERDRPFFSTETDLFLGQMKRRRGGGGRVWTNLYYGDTVLEPKDSDFKIKPDLYGVQLGFDVVQEHGVYATFFGNYNRSKTKFGSGDKSNIDNYLFGFGKYVSLQACHFGFTASVGYDKYQVRPGGESDQAKGDGVQANLFAEFGVDLVFDYWEIKPFYALQYDFLYHGRIGSKEKVFQGDWNDNSFVQIFGIRLKWKPLDLLTFQSRISWVHELLDNPPPFYHMRFSPVHGTMTPAVFFYEGNTGRDWAWIGLGTKFQLSYNVFLFLDYDLAINEYHTTHFGSLGFCLGW